MPPISVIIPAYNAEKFIGEAIESALNQTRPASEIVVVDDASTDRTVEIARSFGDRVKVLVNAVNSGPGHSRNAGAAVSTGDYLAFLDADDELAENHLAELGELLDRWPEAGMTISCVVETDEQGSPLDKPPWRFEGCTEKPMDLFVQAMRGAFIFTGNQMVRRHLFEEVGGYDEIVERYRGCRVQAEDNDLFLRLTPRTRFIASQTPTVFYRRHAKQSSISLTPQQILLYKYRVRLLVSLTANSARHSLFELGQDRLLRAWEQLLELAWAQRELKPLRAYVRYGLSTRMLRAATWPYAVKCAMPEWLLRALKADEDLKVCS